MKKQSKPAPQPLGKESGNPHSTVPPAGPSMDSDHQPVSENDNSANLFEDHIGKQKKEAK